MKKKKTKKSQAKSNLKDQKLGQTKNSAKLVLFVFGIGPIIGPIPNIKSTNFAEFFVSPIFFSFKTDLAEIFFDFFFFMKAILLQNNSKRFCFVFEF